MGISKYTFNIENLKELAIKLKKIYVDNKEFTLVLANGYVYATVPFASGELFFIIAKIDENHNLGFKLQLDSLRMKNSIEIAIEDNYVKVDGKTVQLCDEYSSPFFEKNEVCMVKFQIKDKINIDSIPIDSLSKYAEISLEDGEFSYTNINSYVGIKITKKINDFKKFSTLIYPKDFSKILGLVQKNKMLLSVNTELQLLSFQIAKNILITIKFIVMPEGLNYKNDVKDIIFNDNNIMTAKGSLQKISDTALFGAEIYEEKCADTARLFIEISKDFNRVRLLYKDEKNNFDHSNNIYLWYNSVKEILKAEVNSKVDFTYDENKLLIKDNDTILSAMLVNKDYNF